METNRESKPNGNGTFSKSAPRLPSLKHSAGRGASSHLRSKDLEEKSEEFSQSRVYGPHPLERPSAAASGTGRATRAARPSLQDYRLLQGQAKLLRKLNLVLLLTTLIALGSGLYTILGGVGLGIVLQYYMMKA